MPKDSPPSAVLDALFAVIESRRGADPATSYVAKTLAAGTPEVAKKLGEEAVETVIAAVRGERDEVIGESAEKAARAAT